MKKLAWLVSILSAAAMIAVIALRAPDTIVYHFNYAGEADAWGGKWWYVAFALVPLILIGCYEIYSRKARPGANRALEEKLIPLLPVVFAAIGWAMLLPAIGAAQRLDARIGCGVVVLLGALMAILSNYDGKIAQNRHFGLRTPWTLRDETVWKKTHRVGGVCGVIGGLIAIAAGIAGMYAANAFAWAISGLAVGVALTALAPFAYSYALYKKIHGED